jgi:hypothetical protein
MNAPQLEFAFEITIEVAPGALQELGHTGKGMRRIVPILGGKFEGPAIRGKVLSGGYDWQLGRTDNITEIDARYLLQTDDGALITIVNTGLRYGPADVMQKIAKGDEVAPDTYYFRTIPVFETAAPQYAWCRKHIFIANGIRKPAEVKIQVWKVL